MMAMTHLLVVATVWHKKPITLHPPTNTHIRDYVAVRNRHPSGAPVKNPGSGYHPSLPLVTLSLKGSPPKIHMTLRDLGDAQLRQLMEDLQQEAAQRIDCIHHRATHGPLEGSCRRS